MADADILREVRSRFVGKWQLVRSENFDEFLREMGAPYVARKMAGLSKPDCEISIVDDNICVHTKSAFWSQDDNIGEFNKDFEKEIQKTKMKCHVTFNNGDIIQTMEPIDGSKIKPQKSTRTIDADGNMVLIIEVGDIVAKRIFGRA